MIKLEWSARKNRTNIEKHRIDFSEAATVLTIPSMSLSPILIIRFLKIDK